MALLQVEDLKLHYKTLRGNARAVEDVNFSIEKGETLGLVGESGCGKTSTVIAITRVLPKNIDALDGQVLLMGEDITKLPDEVFRKEVRWKKISMVFQGAMNSLNPVIRVGDQVAEPILLHEESTKNEARERVMDLLEIIGLPKEFYSRYPHELSGGMKQRIVIAMALILNPSLVILDEPTSALDVSIQAQIMNLLKSLKRKLDISMIFITHDIALASDLSDKFAVMYAGNIVEVGNAAQVLTNALHPYTQLLLASTPRLREDVTPSYIPGAPPDLVAPPTGCRFHPRCPKSFDRCSSEVPADFEPEPGHRVKCWLYGG